MSSQQQVLKEKINEVKEVVGLIKQHKVIALASLQKVRALQLQALRKKLKDKASLRVIKNTLMMRALKQANTKSSLDQLEAYLSGATIYLFTDFNPFKLVIFLEKNKIQTTAKAGDIAAFDVIVPAGNTGQPPGPIISQLGSVGLKTRIESGSVWINKDTLVAKKGDSIPANLAAVLSKLGIKPVEAGLVINTVYDDGNIITKEQLSFSLTDASDNIQDAHLQAFYLSVNSAYPTLETIKLLFQKAHHDAYGLCLNRNITTKETITPILRKAYLQALNIQKILQSNTQKD